MFDSLVNQGRFSDFEHAISHSKLISSNFEVLEWQKKTLMLKVKKLPILFGNKEI